MAKITKKNVLSVQGIVNIENGKITFSVEDIEGEIAPCGTYVRFQRSGSKAVCKPDRRNCIMGGI